MNLVIDERLKNRLIGIAVIISIGTIFAPAIIKKSSQRLDEQTIAIKLPPKPVPPKLSMPHQSFPNLTVAHVEVADASVDAKAMASSTESHYEYESTPAMNELKTAILTATKAQLNAKQLTKATDTLIVKNQIHRPVVYQLNKVAATVKKPTKTMSKVPQYAIQLGMFTKQQNAISLIKTLKNKGYHASYTKVIGKKGVNFRVTVGQLNQKQKAVALQQRLASALQMKGIIVTTGIS